MRRVLLLGLLVGCAGDDGEVVDPPTATPTPADDTDVARDTDLPGDTPDTDAPDTDARDTDAADTAPPPDTDPPEPLCERPAGFSPAWQVVRSNDALGMMMSVWGDGSGDVWVVGGQKLGDGFVLRGSGDTFASVALPADTPMLNWVHGTGPQDLWVGGVAGTLLHWDGSGWIDRSLGEAGAVWGLHAKATDDAVAVGGGFFGTGAPFAHRWDGTTWTAVALPSDLGDDGSLFKVHSTDDGYVIVGSGGRSLTLDDAGATSLTSPTSTDMVTVHRDAEGCVAPIAVGGLIQGDAWQLGPTGWTSVATHVTKLNGVHVLGDGSFVAVGDYGGSGWYDASTATWNADAFPVTFDLLHAVWVAPDGEGYAVGGNFLTSGPTFHGVLLRSPAP